jgi:GrpB-like predicted nucleotidyltransferase (UPF0157 family)
LGAMTEDAWKVWLRLRNRFGGAVTLIDLYELEALRRGVEPDELPREVRDELVDKWMPVHSPGWQKASTKPGRSDPVEIVDYDESWPVRFAAWRDRLASALGAVARAIEHVGSTSVTGLPAKPTLDIQISVPGVEDEAAYVPAIESTGLALYAREPGHRLFFPPPGQPRDVHVHVCDADSEWEREHLMFRDRLRRDPVARDEYAQLKRELAKRYRDDRLAYTEAKTGFILDALDEAHRTAARRLNIL